MGKVLSLKLSVEEFGEICNQVIDAFERGEPDVPTALAFKLVGHIEAVYKEQSESSVELLKAIEKWVRR